MQVALPAADWTVWVLLAHGPESANREVGLRVRSQCVSRSCIGVQK